MNNVEEYVKFIAYAKMLTSPSKSVHIDSTGILFPWSEAGIDVFIW